MNKCIFIIIAYERRWRQATIHWGALSLWRGESGGAAVARTLPPSPRGVLPKSKTNENDPIGERTGARIGASLQVWTLLRLRTAALRHLGNTPLKLFLVGMGALRRPRRRAKRLATEQIGLDAPP